MFLACNNDGRANIILFQDMTRWCVIRAEIYWCALIFFVTRFVFMMKLFYLILGVGIVKCSLAMRGWDSFMFIMIYTLKNNARIYVVFLVI
jgi:hypothetical protein